MIASTTITPLTHALTHALAHALTHALTHALGPLATAAPLTFTSFTSVTSVASAPRLATATPTLIPAFTTTISINIIISPGFGLVRHGLATGPATGHGHHPRHAHRRHGSDERLPRTPSCCECIV